MKRVLTTLQQAIKNHMVVSAILPVAMQSFPKLHSHVQPCLSIEVVERA